MRAPSDKSDGGIRAPSTGPPVTVPTDGGTVVRSRLFIKYVVLFVAVVSLVLIANAVFDVYFSYQEQKASLVRIQREQAEAAAGKIGQFISEIESQVGWTTQLPWSASTLEQRRFDALRLLRQVPAITELAEVDSTGHEQLKVSRLAMEVVGSGKDMSKEPAFTEAVAHKVYYGPVYFRRESEPYMTLSLAGTRRDTGVSIAQVNLKLIWDVLSKIKFAGHGRAFVVDAEGRLIAHPDISLVLRNTDMSQLSQVQSARNGAGGKTAEQVLEAVDIEGHKVLTASAPVAPLGWFVFVETPVEEAYAPLYAAIERTGLVLLGALALACAAGLFLARRMVVPIQKLRAGAARLGSGDLGQRIAIKSGDEVEALADQFNVMAGRLQESYANLEQKVEQRTRELSASLEQQTATADVLKVISRSTFDLQSVLDTLVESAARLCTADMGMIFQQDGDFYRLAANLGFSPEAEQYAAEHPVRLDRSTVTGRVALENKAIHVPDVLADPQYDHQRAFGFRTSLGVPLLRERTTIGVFVLSRHKVNPFTDNQIELVTTFADQAVIAIENARLLNELRESLEQQTATSEVLRVISSSPGELKPVFEALLENATRICGSKFGTMYLCEGDAFRAIAMHGAPAAYVWARMREPVFYPGPETTLARIARTKQVVQIADLAAEWQAGKRDPMRVPALELGGVRTLLSVPMLKESKLVGVISIYRTEVRPFTEKQIELVANFAAQAVIAIENARLLSELRLRTDDLGRSVDELRALGEVSQAVNSTLDLETVLSTIVAKAVQLSGTEAGAIYVFDNVQREFRLRATYGMDQAFIDVLARQHIGLDDPSIEQALVQPEPIQVADLKDEAPSELNEITLRAGYRARLVALLLRGEDVVGTLVVRRRTPGTFPQNTVDLIKTFAAQSAVAIENAHLFHNVEASLKDLRAAQDRLVQTEKLASLGQLTAGIAHEIKNPLNFVNNFSAVSVELIDELREALGGVHLDSKLRAEITEIADTLQGNLDKVVQHGKRADAIVKNMLLHSRQGSGEHRPVEINALVDESLNLAYHGARAEKQGFNITLEKSFDPAAGEVDLFPQEITRVLLNLISNGFYATTKRKAESNGGDYEPTLAAATKNLGDSVEIRIRDNGTGIPPEVRERMFNPFFTTKPAGEGTGLGLSISHDIIVKQHGGSIEVDTKPGEFTEFRIVLPRAVASVNKSEGRA
jgi:signal transduction histidine kinase/HAMP domain-containing protein